MVIFSIGRLALNKHVHAVKKKKSCLHPGVFYKLLHKHCNVQSAGTFVKDTKVIQNCFHFLQST